MTAAGLGLNRFCYAGLIAAHKNKTPVTDDLGSKVKYNACSCDYDFYLLLLMIFYCFYFLEKIIELVEQSKGWSSVDQPNNVADSLMMSITDEELYNIPTADYVRRRGFVARQFTVYHAAFYAFAELKDVQV